MPIINSLLNNDLYKLSMAQYVLHNFPTAQVEYAFKCRNGVDLRPYADEIRNEIDSFCKLTLLPEEAAYLNTIRFLKKDFVKFLTIMRLDPANVIIDASGPELSIRIKGDWLYTIFFEVPILAIVNEVYFRNTVGPLKNNFKNGSDILEEKIEFLRNELILDERMVHFEKTTPHAPFLFSDFGTRRRFCAEWQEIVVKKLSTSFPNNFVGTSNVDLARRLGLKPIGTMAHELLMASQAFARLKDSQTHALETWSKEYRGDLGIALSDVLGVDCFLRSFDMYFAKLFDGVRHDSGCPYEWTKKIIEHYKSLGIDPKSKTVVYSDGLTISKAIDLWHAFGGQIKTSFGIGTHLTNHFDDIKPLQVVIKMVQCDGQPVAKISDSKGKEMCEDQRYVDYLKVANGIA